MATFILVTRAFEGGRTDRIIINEDCIARVEPISEASDLFTLGIRSVIYAKPGLGRDHGVTETVDELAAMLEAMTIAFLEEPPGNDAPRPS